MKMSYIGIVITIICLFLGLVVLPMYYIGVVNWRDDYNTAQTASRNFVDRVIDTGEITDDSLADLNLMLASCSVTFTADIYHEVKVTDYDTINGGDSTITRWVYTEDLEQWHSGDIVSVEVRQISANFFQLVAQRIMGVSYSETPIKFSAMVR